MKVINNIHFVFCSQKGVMTVLNQISDLPSTVGRFYSIFRPPTDWGVTYSLPYQDPLGKGKRDRR